MQAKQIWQAALSDLESTLSRANYETWLRNTRLVGFEDDCATIGAPNSFAVEQLRNVSEAVRALPREAVGRDLRESILRRAEAAEQGAKNRANVSARTEVNESDGAPAPWGEPISKLTIGRTPRGWLWASLAVAAALR
jgi:chromosomal replication initiator protein